MSNTITFVHFLNVSNHILFLFIFPCHTFETCDVFVVYVLFRYQKCFGKAVIYISTQRTASAMGQYHERNPFTAWAAVVSAFSATGVIIVSISKYTR